MTKPKVLGNADPRKLAEEENYKLNRLLRCISESNAAMLRATSEDELLSEICNIIVEVGGYRMTFVGYAEEETKTVRPVAWAGFGTEYVRGVKATWKDVPRGRGPVGIAMRTGKPAVVQDTENDPSFAPWRKEALKRDYRSAMAFPLIDGEQRLGMIIVYAAETNAFNEEEIALFNDFADNMVYGIRSLRTVEQRRQTEEALHKAHDELEQRVEERTAKLRISEQRFKDITEATNDWFWEMGPDLRYTFISDRFFEVTGYNPEDIIGKTKMEFTSPSAISENPEMWRAHEEDLINHRPFRNIEYAQKSKDGQRYYVSVSAHPYFDENGEFLGYHGASTNITDRKKVEDLLRQSEQKYIDVVKAQTDIITKTTPDGYFTFVNEAYCKFSGRDVDDLVGSSLSEVVEENVIDDLKAYFAAFSPDRPHHTGEFHLVNPDGELRYFEWSNTAYFDEKGKETEIQSVGRDITDRKAAELELQKRNELVELLHRTAADSNEANDFNDAVKRCLDEVCQATDWPVGHAYFRHEGSGEILYPTDIWHLDDPDKFLTFRKVTEETIFEPGIGLPGRVMISGEPAWIIDVTKDKNFPRAVGAANIGVKAGFALPVLVGSEVVAVLEFFSAEAVEPDYTLMRILINIGTQLGRLYEREKTSKDLHKAMLEADAANRTKTEYLANMNHELRSPLTAIIGFTEMIQSEIFGPIDNEKYVDYLESIHISGVHLSSLINDLLDISAIEDGKMELFEETVEIAEVVEISSTIVQSRANVGKIKLTIEIGKDIPNIVADMRRMKQILVNLLTNAIKFTPEGGSVTLSVDQVEDGTLQFSIMDTGIGMDEDGIAKALEKFGQIDSEQARKHPGTGLGLPLTKELVEMHGGSMLIDSSPGSGTTIKVLIPKDRVIH